MSSIIYKTVNLINNKVYIGQHNQNKRGLYLGSGKWLKRAIKKYGKENFKREIIIEGDFNQKDLNDLETFYIQLFKATDPEFGYNLRPDGATQKGFKHSKETKQKIGEKSRNRVNTNKGKKLKPHTEETKRKISEGNKDKVVSEETRKKLSKIHKGKIVSEESRTKMSNTQKGRVAWNKGLIKTKNGWEHKSSL